MRDGRVLTDEESTLDFIVFGWSDDEEGEEGWGDDLGWDDDDDDDDDDDMGEDWEDEDEDEDDWEEWEEEYGDDDDDDESGRKRSSRPNWD